MIRAVDADEDEEEAWGNRSAAAQPHSPDKTCTRLCDSGRPLGVKGRTTGSAICSGVSVGLSRLCALQTSFGVEKVLATSSCDSETSEI